MFKLFRKKHRINREALRTLKALKLFYKELWCVENIASSECGTAPTSQQWVIYKNRDDALRWIALCSSHFTGEDLSYKVKDLKVGESDEVAFSHRLRKGGTISERFIVTHYCGES